MDAKNLEQKFRTASKISVGIFLIGSFLSILLIILGLVESNAFQRDICINSTCIENFLQFIDLGISGLTKTLSLTITAFTVIGIYFAVLNYISTANTNAISNHLLNLSTFKDYINDELERKGRVSKESIDTFKWYNLLFPHSKKGKLSPGDRYKAILHEIKNCINQSNKEYASPKTPSFAYKPHQERMISALRNIGISIEFMPRNDFSESERQIIDLINTTNQEFCGEQSLPILPLPKYL